MSFNFTHSGTVEDGHIKVDADVSIPDGVKAFLKAAMTAYGNLKHEVSVYATGHLHNGDSSNYNVSSASITVTKTANADAPTETAPAPAASAEGTQS